MLRESDEHKSGRLSLSALLDVVAPLLHQFILEGKAAEDSGHEIKQVTALLLPIQFCSKQLVGLGNVTRMLSCLYMFVCTSDSTCVSQTQLFLNNQIFQKSLISEDNIQNC